MFDQKCLDLGCHEAEGSIHHQDGCKHRRAMKLTDVCIVGACVIKDGVVDHFHSCPSLDKRLPIAKEETMKTREFDSVKDSGERREFATGSVRDIRTGKGRYDLIPAYSLRRLAKHYENGAIKYGDCNWEKGQPVRSYVDSMLRHGEDFLSGDRSEDHLAAVAWNAFAAMWTLEMVRLEKFPESFNDLPLAMADIPAFVLEGPPS